MPAEKTLTQGEVDALLSAFTGAQESDVTPNQGASTTSSRAIKNYDFRRPDKLSKEQVRSLKLLYENFARFLSTSLASYLRGPVAVYLTSVEQITYAEYSEQLPKPTILYLLGLEPLPGRAVFELSTPIAFAMIDRLLGGAGVATMAGQRRQHDELSDIEVVLLQTFTDHLTTALQEAWSDICTIHPQVADLTFTLDLAQAALPNEICVLVMLEIKVLDTSGNLSLCMPYTLLEPIVSQLSAQALVAGAFKGTRRDDPLIRQHALRQLEKVTLPVTVGLGSATVTVDDVLHLERGDIICLDTPASGTLELLIDGRLRGRVRPGVAGPRLAVRIEEVVTPDADLLDEYGASPAGPDTGGVAASNGMKT